MYSIENNQTRSHSTAGEVCNPKTGPFNKVCSALALGSTLFLGAATFAQEAAPQEGPAGALPEDDAPALNLSLTAGIDFTSMYQYHGIIQENQGLIAQPYVELGIPLYSGEGWLSSVDLTLGVWNSWHDGETGSDNPDAGSPDFWYEADYYAILSFATVDNWGVDLEYWLETSPNSGWDRIHELGFTAWYDDSGLWEDVNIPGFAGLQPHASLWLELDNQNDFGNTIDPVPGADEGAYLELGINPGMTLIDDAHYPLTMNVPLTLGLNLGDYYEDAEGNDDTFGFLDAGLEFGMPLEFLSSDSASWEAHAGVHVTTYGDSLQNINAIAGSDDTEVYATIGFSVSF